MIIANCLFRIRILFSLIADMTVATLMEIKGVRSVEDNKKASQVAVTTSEALESIRTGKATPNMVREQFGLSTIKSTEADSRLMKLDEIG